MKESTIWYAIGLVFLAQYALFATNLLEVSETVEMAYAILTAIFLGFSKVFKYLGD